MNRRFVGKALGAALAAPLLSLAAGRARAQADKPLTIVVPYGPGGTTDMLGRLIAQHLAAPLGRTVLVENRPGAGSAVGASHVARAAPDGNTLLVATSSTLAINPSLYAKLPYDPLKDFAPIGMIASVPLALVVHPSVEARNVAELLAAAKRRPGGLSFGSAGNGTPQHLAAEIFKAATGADLRHVPYGGSAAALNDVLGGQLDLMFVDFAPALAHAQGQRLRVLGVTSLARQPTLPDVPTIAESGVSELAQFEVIAWQSLVAPAGTSGEVVARLSQLLIQMIDRPDVRERLQREGVEPRSGSPEQLAATIRADTGRWAKIIKAARISVG